MNKELEEKLMDRPTLLGYRNLVKAIMNCDEEVKERINDEYNSVISSSD
jgi:hypothetical protein